MKIVKDSISIDELKEMCKNMFGNMVKAVVDIEKEIMAVDGDLHADEESMLLENGSKQTNLWGINIFPENPAGEMIEFDSMINLRPSVGNRTRGIDDAKLKDKIINIVNKLVKK